MRKYGLIGRNIDYSFSKNHFAKKFKKEKLDCEYTNFDLKSISEFPQLLKDNPEIKGLNVTIPYKKAIIPFLDSLSRKAEKIGAVNTIKITNKGQLKGYNTDYYGFKESITPLLKKYHKKALILGAGGASRAIIFALTKLGIHTTIVSRSKNIYIDFTYNELTNEIIDEHLIIINCTPLGTFPNVEECPDIPYNAISKKHILYDLVYNPPLSSFLTRGKLKEATICNGEKMLRLQAEKSWQIWN
ncbi:MAG: shikimate dehydrogenase [Flavobacteriaceae bacterium]|nr:MAG: shikimate dehydrogenase [Flavobacteriaceae bacterium]